MPAATITHPGPSDAPALSRGLDRLRADPAYQAFTYATARTSSPHGSAASSSTCSPTRATTTSRFATSV
jgi:hypothetical protein